MAWVERGGAARAPARRTGMHWTRSLQLVCYELLRFLQAIVSSAGLVSNFKWSCKKHLAELNKQNTVLSFSSAKYFFSSDIAVSATPSEVRAEFHM